MQDTGSGISPAELPRLFERFHRVESSKGRTHEGTGIGLPLVQELVKIHGGIVNVESEVGRGSTFHRHNSGQPESLADRMYRKREEPHFYRFRTECLRGGGLAMGP